VIIYLVYDKSTGEILRTCTASRRDIALNDQDDQCGVLFDPGPGVRDDTHKVVVANGHTQVVAKP